MNPFHLEASSSKLSVRILIFSLIILICSVSIKLCDGILPGQSCFEGLVNGSIDYYELRIRYAEIFDVTDDIVPLHHDYGARRVVITSYDCSLEKSIAMQRQTDILESIHTFGFKTWIVTILFCILIGSLIRCHFRLNNINQESPEGSGIWTVASSMLYQPYMRRINFVSDILLLLLSLFVFLVVTCYFSNGVKSDKVTTYIPYVFTTLDDVTSNQDVEVLFPKVFEKAFKLLPPKNKYRKVYERIRGMKYYSSKKFNQLGDALSAEIKTQRVLITETGMFDRDRSNLCKLQLKLNRTGICYYIAMDSIDQTDNLGGWLASRKFQNRKVYREYMKIFRLYVDMGIKFKQRKNAFHHNLIVTPNILDCFSKVIVTHEPEYAPFSLINYRYALLCLLFPLTCALVSLIREFYHSFLLQYDHRINIRHVKIHKRKQ